jgi:hypothetical protein
MDSISLNKVNEMIDDNHKPLKKKFFFQWVEVLRSSCYDQIVWPTSDGLRRPTPTNDYIDNEVDSSFNPSDDYVDWTILLLIKNIMFILLV